jgi:alpha-1,3-fucosyltransferase
MPRSSNKKKPASWRQLLLCVFVVLVTILRLHTSRPVVPLLEISSPPSSPQEESSSKSSGKDPSFKYILYYTKYWNKHDFQFGIGHQPFLDYKCPQSSCIATDDPTFLKEQHSGFDAVLFSANAVDLDLNDTLKQSIQKWRQPEQQVFVWLMMECPNFVIPNFQNHDNFFNLTMTYRWDSDIPRPYGWFQDKAYRGVYPPPPESITWKEFNEIDIINIVQQEGAAVAAGHRLAQLANRPKKVAWLVSNCRTDSERELFVRRLKKYIDIDIFGSCPGAIPCDAPYSLLSQQQSSDNNNCTRAIRNNYKFYLSLENNFCNQYVTEKFFGRVKDHVVITGTQANLTLLAPPHSHISALDFKSAEELAQFLHYLDHNDTAYLSYFWWQDHYQVKSPSRDGGDGTEMMKNNFGQAMCQLCDKLHHSDVMIHTKKTYSDMRGWWINKGECGREMFPDENKGMGMRGTHKPYKGAMFRPAGAGH